ncbi:MAG TPA: alpha/beta fold hydrolase [Croceibacterium sp.]
MLGEGSEATLRCDHGFVEYQVPTDARPVALFLWHSSSTAVWQNRWDGGEGFQSLFLRRRYPIYLWDGPRVGRANWGCEDYTYKALAGRDQQNHASSWRFGPKWGEWYPGVQFPTHDAAAYDQAMRARYDEFDVIANARLEAAVAAKALERVGPSVLVTSSAGGLRALLAATQSDKVRAIVAYENPGYLFPEGEGPEGADSPFGPLRVTREEFLRLTKVPMQFVWGDNLDKSPLWQSRLEQCRAFVALINANGGQAEILLLPNKGLRGNTHMPFADMNNEAVAALLAEYLAAKGLD